MQPPQDSLKQNLKVIADTCMKTSTDIGGHFKQRLEPFILDQLLLTVVATGSNHGTHQIFLKGGYPALIEGLQL